MALYARDNSKRALFIGGAANVLAIGQAFFSRFSESIWSSDIFTPILKKEIREIRHKDDS